MLVIFRIAATCAFATQSPAHLIQRDVVALLPVGLTGQLKRRDIDGTNATTQDCSVFCGVFITRPTLRFSLRAPLGAEAAVGRQSLRLHLHAIRRGARL